MILGLWALLVRLFSGKKRKAEGTVIDAINTDLENAHVQDAIYERTIAADTDTIKRVKDAVSSLDAQRSIAQAELVALTKSIQEKRTTIEDAKFMASERDQELAQAGKSDAEIEADPEIQEYMHLCQDDASTLGQMEERANEYEQRIEYLNDSIEEKKSVLRGMYRRLDALKTERQEAKADLVIDKQMEEIADMMAGINTEGNRAELQAAREVRAKLKSRSKLATEFSGMDATAQREKLRAKVQAKKAASDFMGSIRASRKAESEAANPASTEKTAVAEKGDPPPLS